jgi:hypothetical protein
MNRKSKKISKSLSKKSKQSNKNIVHIIHCISQLKRFNKSFLKGDLSRTLQFGYNLGRLQELSGKPDHKVYWQPIEKYYNSKDFLLLDKYIDEIKTLLNVEYDTEIISK